MSKRYLFIVPGRLGDALMITPALRLLKHCQPDSQIDVLAYSELSEEVYRNNPNCGKILNLQSILNGNVRAEDYDLLIAPHLIPDLKHLGEAFPRPMLLAEKPNFAVHQSAQALRFIGDVFCNENYHLYYPYEIYPDEQDQSWANAVLDQRYKYIGMHLGCHGINKTSKKLFSWPRKTRHRKLWPVSHYIALAKFLQESYPHHKIVLTGGPNEIPLSQKFMQEIPNAINLMGQTSVLQLAAVMQRFSVYICPDSGTMHLACAVNIPLVTLFGPTDAMRTGPFLARHQKILQQKNLEELPVEDVVSAVHDVMRSL